MSMVSLQQVCTTCMLSGLDAIMYINNVVHASLTERISSIHVHSAELAFTNCLL